MLMKISTDNTLSETAAALQAAVPANHFGVMQVHNLKKTLAKKGVAFARECLIFEASWMNPFRCGRAFEAHHCHEAVAAFRTITPLVANAVTAVVTNQSKSVPHHADPNPKP